MAYSQILDGNQARICHQLLHLDECCNNVTKEGQNYRMVTSSPDPFDLYILTGIDVHFS